MENKMVSHSPHLRSKDTTSGIMLDVIIALVPALLVGFAVFGPWAVAVVAVTVGVSLLSEFICNKIMKKQNSLTDLSAVVTGLLLGMNLPSTLPLWMAAIGAAVSIVVVKMMFGGLGQNFANPAIVGRIVLMVSFTSAMTNWATPFSWLTSADAVTSATALAGGKYSYLDLFLGNCGGCIGEVSAAALLLGGIYLVARRVIIPVAPIFFIGTVALMSWIFGADPLTAILSGGVFLGAIFMATDYVTTPTTPVGSIIFGIGCGIITVVIRQFGSLPEGVSYSILIMNLLTPHIDNITRLKPFGWRETQNDRK